MDPEDCHSVKDALTRCYRDAVSDKPLENRNTEKIRFIFSQDVYINKLIDVYNN